MGLIDTSSSLGTAKVLWGLLKNGTTGGASKLWKAPTEAKSLAFGGALGFAMGSDGYFEHALNAASIGSLFYTPLVPFVSVAFIAKGIYDIFKGIGCAIKGDMAGFGSNMLSGGLSIVFALPGLKGVTLLAKSKGLLMKPLTGEAKAALEIKSFTEVAKVGGKETTVLSKKALQTIDKNIERLNEVKKTIGDDIAAINKEVLKDEKEIAAICRRKKIRVASSDALAKMNKQTPNMKNVKGVDKETMVSVRKILKDEVKSATKLKGELEGTVKALKEELSATKEFLNEASKGVTDKTVKDALAKSLGIGRQEELLKRKSAELLKETKRLTQAQTDLATLQRAGKNIGRAKAARAFTQKELNKIDPLIKDCNDVKNGLLTFDCNEAELLAKYNNTLQTLTYDSKTIFNEIMRVSYGKDAGPFKAVVNSGFKAIQTTKEQGVKAAAKETATSARDSMWRVYDWFKAGKANLTQEGRVREFLRKEASAAPAASSTAAKRSVDIAA
jgi:uncharacterized protein (UPF0335 family)